MNATVVFEAVIHDVYLNSVSANGFFNEKYPNVVIVEASPFLAERMEKDGQLYCCELFRQQGRLFVVFRASEETIRKYTPGDIINLKAARTHEGFSLSL